MIKLPGKKSSPKSSKKKGKPASHANLPRFVVLAGTAGFIGVLLTYALLQLLLISPYTDQVQQQQADSSLTFAARLLDQEVNQLQRETQALAASRPIAEALLTKDLALQKKFATNASSAIGHALQVRIRVQGDYQQDRSGKVPMNYAAIDLQRRVERGQAVQPEFSKNGQLWSLQTAAPIRSGNRIIGTLLVHYDVQRIKQTLAVLPNDFGRLELLQKFEDNPTQTVMTQGQGSGQSLLIKTRNPFWQLRFTPGPAIQNNTPDTLFLPLAVIGGLLTVLIGTLLASKLQYQAHRKDAAQLLNQVKAQLAGQEAPVAHFILPAFKNLALTLRPLLKSTPAPAKASVTETVSPPKTSEPAPSQTATNSMPPLPDLLEADDEFSASLFGDDDDSSEAAPLFQDDDILEIEELDDDLLIEDAPAELDSEPTKGTVNTELPPAEIFRAYDIRGIVDQTLTESGITLIGQAIATVVREQGYNQIIVGADGRLSSPILKQCLIHGLVQAGVDVIDIGQVPTPALYFATCELGCPNGVMLTGSHNPSEYNGVKIVIDGHPYAGEQLKALYQRIQNQEFSQGQGHVKAQNLNVRYQDRILEDVVLARSLKVVVDAGNGVAGPIVEQLYAELGCEVIPLFCEVDGQFPNHHPDPSKPANLEALIERVKAEGADLGLAFDGDGDRVGLVTNQGDIVWPDRLLMLLAKDVVTRNPGADIIFDVKCSRRLNALISGYGGRPVMWKTGHSFIKEKMQETDALLAGEMSGHIFFKERWYGFDDGIYSGARLLEVIASDQRPVDQIFSAFPAGYCTPEINIKVRESEKFAIIDKLIHQGDFSGGTLIDLDGVRVEYPDSWGLIRASNTTPTLTLRFEADTEEALQRVQDLFRQELRKVAPTLPAAF